MSDIMQAISEDNYLQIKKLIHDGIDINEIIENEENENDECLIFYALHKKCSYETLIYMVENGVDLEFSDSQGVGLLDEAIVSGNMEFIKYLIEEKNMDVNETKRKSGLTPVIQATCYGNIDLVKLLISHGADLTIKDKFNLNAVDYARKLQRKKMQEFLENLG
jgi:ankyrin repeat protein